MKKVQYFKTKESFPIAGKEMVLYLDEETKKIYKWSKSEAGTYSYELFAEEEKDSFVGPHPQKPPK